MQRYYILLFIGSSVHPGAACLIYTSTSWLSSYYGYSHTNVYECVKAICCVYSGGEKQYSAFQSSHLNGITRRSLAMWGLMSWIFIDLSSAVHMVSGVGNGLWALGLLPCSAGLYDLCASGFPVRYTRHKVVYTFYFSSPSKM